MNEEQFHIPPGPDDPVQIFVSYAHDDNSVPPGLEPEKGFVTVLISHLEYILTRRGHPRPKIWWDQRRIDKADRFDNIIQEAIKRSSLLLVVMSTNWLSRPWCRKELELFAKRQDSTEHMVLVRANHVEPAEHPDELQNIEGYDFFSLDEWREPGNERFFVDQGEICDKLFTKRVSELGSVVWRRASNVRRKIVPPQPLSLAPASVARISSLREPRTIYLAKPAPDTAVVYDRIANDLMREGYQVVPPIGENIPAEAAARALQFVDSALESAEASIHLLGDKPGYKPDELDHIVPLQLARAGERAKLHPTNPNGARFTRIVWAPKSPEDDCRFPAAALREPITVLDRFDHHCEGDQLYGDVFSAFQSYLKRELERRVPPSRTDSIEQESFGSRIYVWHRKDDREFARKVRKWLRDHDAEAILPGNDEDPDRDKLHRQNLADCSAVFLCWAQATDVWAKMSASQLRSWRDLGRKERFSVRGLVLGPPPGESKSEDDMPLPSEIDEVLDLSHDNQLMLDRLQQLLDRSRASHLR
ncbi:toll/interleukin-1 receptor domain-containing protein [Bradyrhizobium sp. B124]|uniref:toll/interleukin-1 receptor domain-containing protein n=1 Tax=Bradyrhizobium sp. B124 TaxID=3140245 RepID=UPI00318387E6